MEAMACMQPFSYLLDSVALAALGLEDLSTL
jgi:hypothetical protein